MKKATYLFLAVLAGTLLLSALLLTATSCGKLTPFFGSSTTSMTSSTFSGLSANSITKQGTYESGFWKESPTKITGKVVSVFFPIDNTVDEGIVVYGYYRPDIAPDNAGLLNFDLSTVTRLSGIISKKPGYVGGKAGIIMMQYSYFDVHFTRGNTEEVIRFCYGTTDPQKRGDVMYKDTDGQFKWLDTTSNSWATTRPANPQKIDFIANYQGGPDHPDEKYFPLAGKVTSPSDGVNLPASLIDNNDLAFTVDFDYQKALLFENVTTQASFDATPMTTLIKWADMSQNRTEWGNVVSTTDASSIISCTVTVEATPRKGM